MDDTLKTALLVICGILVGCIAGYAVAESGGQNPMVGTQEVEGADILFQQALIGDLLAGSYDGTITFGDLAQHGDFGIGTLDHLDGEMIAFDGIFYQVRSDGTVHVVEKDATTPLAQVTFYSPDITYPITTPVNMSAFEAIGTAELPDTSHFYAIRADGTFASVTTRSVPAQDPPYPLLTTVVANQSVFSFHNVTGTIVGIWSPAYADGSIGAPGFHFHFLTADHTAGGHILNFVMEDGTVGLDRTEGFTLVVPKERISGEDIVLSEDALAQVEHGGS